VRTRRAVQVALRNSQETKFVEQFKAHDVCVVAAEFQRPDDWPVRDGCDVFPLRTSTGPGSGIPL